MKPVSTCLKSIFRLILGKNSKNKIQFRVPGPSLIFVFEIILHFQIAYAVFLAVYTYICLVRTPLKPSWPEIYVTACMICYGFEKVRTLIAAEPPGFFEKIQVWYNDTKWNLFDSLAISTFLFAFGLRCFDPNESMVPYEHNYRSYGRVIYATDICYW